MGAEGEAVLDFSSVSRTDATAVVAGLTPAGAAVKEYLRTTYHPDREYVDGHLVERNVGERDRSLSPSLLAD